MDRTHSFGGPAGRQSKAVHFAHRAREEQLRAFYAWLPPELHATAGVDWSLLPDIVMGYCIQTIGSSPDAAYLALAAASACGAISANSLFQLLGNLHALFTTLRTVAGMERVSDLEHEALWHEFADKTQATRSRSTQLSAYSVISTKHYPKYLEQLSDAGGSPLKQQYWFPRMPQGFLSQVGKASELNNSSRMRQKVIRERLLPLFPLLRQLVWMRKQLSERVLQDYRLAKQQVASGAPLPFAFQRSDLLPWLHQQGGTGELRQRDLSLHFRLWNKRSWVLHHQDRYDQRAICDADSARGIYSSDRDHIFVQFDGASQDLLWFGNLVEQRLLQDLHWEPQRDSTHPERQRAARDLGFSRGCITSRNGLLQADARWFAEHARQGDLLFEPEACYRGILYGAALATLAMTTGGSVSEILQVSADRWRSAPDGLEQLLLPGRAKAEQERRPFRISAEGVHLLEEIVRGLEEFYGEIPVIPASRQLTNCDRLPDERYVFQWQKGMICPLDTEVLVRFLLRDVTLHTSEGTPIRFSMGQLRYGGDDSLEERAEALLRVFGFNQSIVPHLSPLSLDAYCHVFFAYWQFAGSKEAALQPQTLVRWTAHMEERHYTTSTIKRNLSVVQSIFKAAGAPEKGYIDQSTADAFQHSGETRATQPPSAAEQADAPPHVTYSHGYKKCGKPDCHVCRVGKEHGPYWYARWREKGKSHSVCVGREKNERTVAQALQKIEKRREEGDHSKAGAN